jgi:hypothetical protein
MSAEDLDLIAGWVSFVLTLMIFSYLLMDNFLYRIAVHLLVGVTAGYITILAVENVILPWIDITISADNSDTEAGFRALGIIPFLLGLMLIFKYSPRLAPVGNFGIAFIVGVGTGVAIVGAVVGTLIPLADDAGLSFEEHNIFNGLVMTLGTISTLVYFQYLAKRRMDGKITRSRPMLVLSLIGRATIAITFGAIYAGVVITSLSVFSGIIAEQIEFLLK